MVGIKKKGIFPMTKELQKNKKNLSKSPESLVEKVKDQVADIEVDADIRMAPKKEYPVKVKITKIEKARPKIDPREFEVMLDMEEENL